MAFLHLAGSRHYELVEEDCYKSDHKTSHIALTLFVNRLASLGKFAKTLQKGQLITLGGTLQYRKVEDEVEGTQHESAL
jgi:hypothetical protein